MGDSSTSGGESAARPRLSARRWQPPSSGPTGRAGRNGPGSSPASRCDEARRARLRMSAPQGRQTSESAAALAIAARIEDRDVPAVPVQGCRASGLEYRRCFGKPMQQERGPPVTSGPGRAASGLPGGLRQLSRTSIGSPGHSRSPLAAFVAYVASSDRSGGATSTQAANSMTARMRQTIAPSTNATQPITRRKPTVKWMSDTTTLPGDALAAAERLVGAVRGVSSAFSRKATRDDSVVGPGNGSTPAPRSEQRNSPTFERRRAHHRPGETGRWLTTTSRGLAHS